MRRKPLVGVNSDFRAGKNNSPSFSYLSVGYCDALTKAGAIPLVLPPLEQPEDIESLLDRLDAVVLIGGADLDPRRDGYMLHPSVRLMDPRREDFDRTLVDLIAQRRLPVFGIGAGMQLLNVAAGGTLFLHIPEDSPQALPHIDPIDRAHRHSLEVMPGTLLERVYGDGEIRVNSMHHMAVDDLGQGLRVTARCPDGIVEALESVSENWFVLGTQFHPEGDFATALDQRIFDEFLVGVTGEVRESRLVA